MALKIEDVSLTDDMVEELQAARRARRDRFNGDIEAMFRYEQEHPITYRESDGMPMRDGQPLFTDEQHAEGNKWYEETFGPSSVRTEATKRKRNAA